MKSKYKITIGDKITNKIFRSANLFQLEEGIGTEKILIINWKKGEKITEERARKIIPIVKKMTENNSFSKECMDIEYIETIL